MSTNVIGISCFFHDAACCLLKDGVLVAAAEEERFSRNKHDAGIPKGAFNYCLEEGGLTIDQVDYVAYYEEPAKKLARQIWMMLPGLPSERVMARLDPRRPEREIREVLGYDGPIEYVGHHQSHAASAFYYSGFKEAAILTVDGVGEWDTTSFGRGNGDGLEMLETVEFPHSIGLLYSTITGYLGFEVNEGEYKVMGLAPYGKPRYVDLIRQLIVDQPGGQYALDLRYFDFASFKRMYSDAMLSLFGHPPRQPRTEILDFHKDLARSLQYVLEEILMGKIAYLHERTGSENLCMAGGVALNCVANGRIKREGPFKRIFVQPAAGDSGGALGAAAIAHKRRTNGKTESLSTLRHAYLGPSFSSEEVTSFVQSTGVKARDFRGREADLLEVVARMLAAGKIVGWFHGRMEFGPRALGARSILADPRGDTVQDRINSLIKQRESFRPFAPAVLEDRAAAHFDLDHASRYMLETCQVKSPIKLPAITHVDGSARVQTVDGDTNPRFARLLQTFERLTGCPILLNTSFNMNYEPIVCTPADALICFIRSGLDVLVLEDYIIDRSAVSATIELLMRLNAQVRPDAITFKTYTLF